MTHSVFARRPTIWLGLALPVVALVFLAAAVLPLHTDWVSTFRPAALELLAGRSPYNVTTFFNPPWVLIPILPIAILPIRLGNAVMFVGGIVTYVVVAYRLKARPLAVLLLLLSYPVIDGLQYGQIDWLTSIGFVLPPPIGLLFIMTKPQVGVAVAIFWGVEAWRTGRLRRVVRLFSPLALAGGLSILLFGVWFTHDMTLVANTSFWPKSIPIGLVLLVAAIRSRRFNLAMIASPFLSPYIGARSWSVVLLGLIDDVPLLAAASAGLWAVWLLGGGPPV